MRSKAKRATRYLVLAGLLALVLSAATAQANRSLLSKAMLVTKESGPSMIPPPEGQIEGACGLAVAPGGDLYVSDYYHGRVHVFSSSGLYQSGMHVASAPEGPCGLAIDSTGRLYVNVWHQRALRLLPAVTIDDDDTTGIAVDRSTDRLYVNDRTYVAVYDSSGAPVLDGGEPLLIGVGSLGDAYGLAAFEGRVYVPDADQNVIEVYEPASDSDDPVDVIDGLDTFRGQFVSLVDAALAVDPSNGNLLVVDNVQPGFTHPQAVIYEFDSSGAFLGQLPGAPVVGEPSGIAVASDGTLYVTDGNGEKANVFEYSPYSGFGLTIHGPPQEGTSQPLGGGVAQSAPLGPPAPAATSAHPRPLRAGAELVQKGSIRVAVSGDLAPKRLPRKGTAPITVRIGGHITSTDPDSPPQLRKVVFAFNRGGRLDSRGLQRCRLSDIDPSTSAQALEACRPALVGEGRFSATVRLPEQSPFPSAGKVLAFNGMLKGEPVIFAHIYGTKPVPTSVVLPLQIRRGTGTFATRLEVSLASLTGDWGYVTGIDLKLGRRFGFRGERRSFLSAGCPAPKGFPGALFPLAKATFSFIGGRELSATLTRSCTARG